MLQARFPFFSCKILQHPGACSWRKTTCTPQLVIALQDFRIHVLGNPDPGLAAGVVHEQIAIWPYQHS